jgi:hypothetical protein
LAHHSPRRRRRPPLPCALRPRTARRSRRGACCPARSTWRAHPAATLCQAAPRRPLPGRQVPTPPMSQRVTDSAACSTNVSRSHDVRRVLGTHTLVHTQPNEKQVGDKGIDGLASVGTATSTSPTFPGATRVHRSALASVPDSTVVPAAAEVDRNGAFPRTGVDALAVVATRDAPAMWPGRRRCRRRILSTKRSAMALGRPARAGSQSAAAPTTVGAAAPTPDSGAAPHDRAPAGSTPPATSSRYRCRRNASGRNATAMLDQPSIGCGGCGQQPSPAALGPQVGVSSDDLSESEARRRDRPARLGPTMLWSATHSHRAACTSPVPSTPPGSSWALAVAAGRPSCRRDRAPALPPPARREGRP